MAMGSALVGGYRQGQPEKRRSFMPAINTLGSMVAARRRQASRGGGRRFVMSSGESGLDRRSREREERHQAEKAREEEKYRYERDQRNLEERQAQAGEILEAEEGRRQETHEAGMEQQQVGAERSAMAAKRGKVIEGREDVAYGRKEAYNAIKQGIMMRDSDMVEQGFQGLAPTGEDEITYETLEDGTRKVSAAPMQRDVPQFIFHPDGYVGVQFPGEDKPVVFKDADEAFKNVVAPMNPDRWDSTTKGTAKDKVAAAKNKREADYKDKKLQAEVHDKAHAASMAQFEADGYYQPALYNEDKYWEAYNNYVEKATGSPPVIDRGDQGVKGAEGGQPEQYTGDDAPEGFPGARRGPRGGWYVQKKGKWYPVLKGKEKAPGQPGPKGRKPMTADTDEMQASGVNVPAGRKKAKAGRQPLTAEQQARVDETGVRKSFNKRGKKVSKEGNGEVYRGTAPPTEYPDAQFDRDEGVWYYFNGDNQQWEKVMV